MPTRTHLASFLIVLIAVIGLFSYPRHARIVPPVTTVSAVATTTETEPTAGAAAAPAAAPRATASSAPVANAALIIGGTSYPITVSPKETVIDAMNALMAAGKISFAGRDYPGMGFFVDSINGRGSAGGKYWMLYVNGVSAMSGASATAVHAGDAVEWRYEQGY